ncbi:PKD domain-containing protein [Arenibacter sp. TNZ]|jgi:PKD repeat protein|uniref:PKD domain-containing protein n=1 Tax=Arenibacter TaxID=178469 RepID=UPI000CD465CD|nr:MULTISPECIES: PKD domain-containing protein [Arenibacter]MCM4172594.1 PKD domain-containing protein [Arenibacter sp. TNZ]
MKNIKILSTLLLAIILVNCSDDNEPQLPLSDFQFLVEGSVVTFNGTVENTTSISWDFGDGSTSSEEDPVYAFASPGTYNVVMTVIGSNGTYSETKKITILPTLDILLTGGPARPQGKTWRLKKAYTAGKDGAGMIENKLGLLIASFDNLLGAVGLGASYDDAFTFVYDGTYKVDNIDGQSLMGIIQASAFHGANITAVSADLANVPLAHAIYAPITDATWELNEEDFTINTLYPQVGPVSVNFTGKQRLILGEYLGFKETSNIVILKEITETTMNVALGIHTEQDYYDTPTLFFHLTLESL